jgi:ABC-type lipoprotein export system ATPase subunit
MHIRSRGLKDQGLVDCTVRLANLFTGEAIHRSTRMTELSGGQTRSLMIADALLISDAPIVLLDEVENAGIFKQRVMEILKEQKKALIFVTHDPLVSLMTERRIVMSDGAVVRIITPNGSERDAVSSVLRMDTAISRMRDLIRAGELLTVPAGF